MAQKNKDSITENVNYYKEYFKEDLAAIEEELAKSKEYSVIIDTEIQKLSGPSLGSNRGGQHYLIEHINNAVNLQTQRQSLRRDKFAIKKAIIDYSAKFADEEKKNDDELNLIDKINELIENDKKKATIKNEKSISNIGEDLDDIIDAALKNN